MFQNIEYLLLNREMLTLQEVNRVINVKYQCHEATMSTNVTQKSNLADAQFVPSGHIFVP